jgi:hypothetical protein
VAGSVDRAASHRIAATQVGGQAAAAGNTALRGGADTLPASTQPTVKAMASMPHMPRTPSLQRKCQRCFACGLVRVHPQVKKAGDVCGLRTQPIRARSVL